MNRFLAPPPRPLTVIQGLEQHERILTCTSCRTVILVCGYVVDLNPATYVGVACGCRLKANN